MISDEEMQAAMAALERIMRDVFGNALAMHALHAARGGTAMLGLDGAMVDAGFERRLHGLPYEALCARKIEAQAHMGGGEGLLRDPLESARREKAGREIGAGLMLGERTHLREEDSRTLAGALGAQAPVTGRLASGASGVSFRLGNRFVPTMPRRRVPTA